MTDTNSTHNTNNTNNEGDIMSDNNTNINTDTATSTVEPVEVVEDTATDPSGVHSSYVPVTPLGMQRPRWTQVIKHPLVIGAVAVAIASAVSGTIGWYQGVEDAKSQQNTYERGVLDGRNDALDERNRIDWEVESRRVDVLDPPLSGRSVRESIAELETESVAVERDAYLVIPAHTPLPKNVFVFGEVVSNIDACFRVGGNLELSDPIKCDKEIRVKYVVR